MRIVLPRRVTRVGIRRASDLGDVGHLQNISAIPYPTSHLDVFITALSQTTIGDNRPNCLAVAMSLPGLALPGIIEPSVSTQPAAIPQSAPSVPRTETLPPRSELRYEISPTQTLTVRLLRGTAECFGTELAPNVAYNLSHKGAIYTWHGCNLELTGEAESEYIGTATEGMVEWLNIHGLLEDDREDALAASDPESLGPRVLVVGPASVGKSSLLKTLTAWALKTGRTPTVANLDPSKGMYALPSTISAFTANTALDIESAAWEAPGPTTALGTVPEKDPLVMHFPFKTPDESTDDYRAVSNRLALSVTARLTKEQDLRSSGLLIDSPAAFNAPKSAYALLSHVVSEFSVNYILVMGSERLYNDMTRKYNTTSTSNGSGNADKITVLRVATSPGAVAEDATSATRDRARLLRSYFFERNETLHPKAYSWDYDELHIFRLCGGSQVAQKQASGASASFLPGMGDGGGQGDDDDDYDPTVSATGTMNSGSGILEKVEPSPALIAGLFAIKYAAATEDHAAIRDSCVIGFVYVADVHEASRKVRCLYPHPGKFTDRAWVWCQEWPEAVPDLAM